MTPLVTQAQVPRRRRPTAPRTSSWPCSRDELRNPLAPIVTSAALLRRPGIPAPVVERSAGIVERQARSLARLLDDLLDVSRITRNRIELRWTVLSIADAVERALEATRPLFHERRHAVSVRTPRGNAEPAPP